MLQEEKLKSPLTVFDVIRYLSECVEECRKVSDEAFCFSTFERVFTCPLIILLSFGGRWQACSCSRDAIISEDPGLSVLKLSGSGSFRTPVKCKVRLKRWDKRCGNAKHRH